MRRTLGEEVAMVQYVLAALVGLAVLLLVAGAVRGRVEVRSCCAADPHEDLRMRDAFDETADR
jgi:hypothetical protein